MSSRLVGKGRWGAWSLLLLMALLPCAGNAAVRINEFLAENDGLLRDQDGDSVDWIELQNVGTNAVNLAGWHLSDDSTNLAKWTFPPVNVQPGAYLVVFASGKDRAISGGELHTNFQLDSSGGFLALVQPDGTTGDSYFYPPQHANVSYGIESANTQSPILALDFGRRAMDQSTLTQAGFSSFLINSNGGTIIQTNATIRSFGSISITVSNTTPFGYDDRLRSVPLNSGAFTDSLLLRDFIFSQSRADNGGLDVLIQGLTPNQFYLFTIWSFDGNSPGSRVSDWYANGVLVKDNYAFSGQTSPTSNEQYRFSFQSGANVSGQILISGRRDSASVGSTGAADLGVFLNALQITQVDIEPDTGTNKYFAQPTPGLPNGTGYFGVVADTKFSVNRGFYDSPFSLSLTTATENAEIWFTTNGGAPSPTNGTQYSAPILITNTAFIRAAAYKTGYIPSDVDTHTYIFLNSVLRQPGSLPGYPTIWQASYPADYGMDSNIVNDPKYGATISNDLRSIPTLSLVSDHNGLWNQTSGIYPNPTSSGDAWERAASAELIDGSGRSEFSVRCGLELHGNASRDNVRTPKHSMRMTFKHEYGPTRLHYDWFGGGVDVHDGMILRGCGFVDGWAGRYADNSLYTSTETGETFRGLRYRPENTCYLRDAWVKESFRDMGWSASRSTFVHLYINGLYWGLYEPSERLTASYFSLLLGGQEGAWDVVVGEDNNGPPVLVDGSLTDWQNVLNIVNAGITNEAAYQAVAQRVDIDNLIDYMMVHIFAESEDWPRHNWYVAHRRATNGVAATKFICTAWDQELTLDRLVRRNRIDVGGTGGEIYGPGRVYMQLRAWPEFRRQFGDRVQRHLFNGGALTPSNSVARLLAPASVIYDALVGESARWGDARSNGVPSGQIGTGKTFTRDEWWQPEIDKLATNFLVKLTADNIARFRAGNLYPNVSAPDFSQFGGGVTVGYMLSMTHTNPTGVIYFTMDGTDPRTYGTGAVAPAAQAYSEPVALNSPTLVRARVLSGGSVWSALVEAPFYPPQDLSRLVLTEIMYNPPALGGTNGDEFEFIELKNAGTNALNLSALTFTSGVSFTFSNGTTLLPGQFFVLGRNAAALAAKYPGLAVNGIYSGRLDNAGERLALSHPLGPTILSVTYNDRAPWPAGADNLGFSIVPRHAGVSQAPDNGASWRASAYRGGSPGADDPAPPVSPVFINEILSASVAPDVDEIELFNPNAETVDVSGWFLTDDAAAPQKFRIPNGIILAPGGFRAFTESDFNPTPGIGNSFSLSSRGEQVYLFSADASGILSGFSHGFSFDPAADGVSFGRYVNSVGEEQFPAQVTRTFDSANAGPRVGPVVLNEIHYHPDAIGDEFIEFYNLTSTNVPLSGSAPWRLNGLNFDFPAGSYAPANGFVLLVATNPAVFQAKYAIPTNVVVLGPYAGALQDSGERLRLERPGLADSNGIPYITVDEVRYNDKAPWPPAADGSGPSLQRRNSFGYGDDPINWLAAPPTPGARNGLPDSDGDGLPDEWELANGTSASVPDANDDPDGDGFTNFQEYLAATDPRDANSYLRISQIDLARETVVLRFTAVADRSYRILFKDRLDATQWDKLQDVSSQSSTRIAEVIDFIEPNQTRFYRLVTP